MSRANTVGKITFEIYSGWAGADLRSEHTYINSKDARAFFEGLLNAYVCREGSFPRETEQRSASRPGTKKSLLRNVKDAPGQVRGYLCFYHAGRGGPRWECQSVTGRVCT